MSLHSADQTKYVVDEVVAHFEATKTQGSRSSASRSNKPELVVVESPVSGARMREMFKAVDAVLRTHTEVGQTI